MKMSLSSPAKRERSVDKVTRALIIARAQYLSIETLDTENPDLLKDLGPPRDHNTMHNDVMITSLHARHFSGFRAFIFAPGITKVASMQEGSALISRHHSA